MARVTCTAVNYAPAHIFPRALSGLSRPLQRKRAEKWLGFMGLLQDCLSEIILAFSAVTLPTVRAVSIAQTVWLCFTPITSKGVNANFSQMK